MLRVQKRGQFHLAKLAFLLLAPKDVFIEVENDVFMDLFWCFFGRVNHRSIFLAMFLVIAEFAFEETAVAIAALFVFYHWPADLIIAEGLIDIHGNEINIYYIL